MAVYPADPSLAAVTGTTAVDSDFLNQFVDNINAIGADLRILSDNAGNIDLAIDKGIKWATTLEIYMSAGDLVLDDGVVITGNLDVTGTISGTFSVGAGLDIPGTLTVDTIDDSGAAKISVLETIEMGAGKGIQGDGVSALAILAGCNVTGALDVSGTLTVNTIDDSGAGAITVNEDMVFAAGKYIDVPTLRVDTIIDSGAGEITMEDSLIVDAGATTEIYCRSGVGDEIILHADGDSRYILMSSGDAGDPDFPANDQGIIFFDNAGNLITKIAEGAAEKEGILMPFAPTAYTVTNDLTDRTYDANTVAVEELADVVGTLIADLQTLGLIG